MWNVSKYFLKKIFSKNNALQLFGVFFITLLTTALTVGTPFTFGALITNQSFDLFGWTSTFYQLISIYVIGVTLNKLLPIVRKMLNNTIVSKVTYDTVYKFDRLSIEQPYDYQVNTTVGKKEDQLLTARTGSTDYVNQFLNIIPLSLELSGAAGILTLRYGLNVGGSILGLLGFTLVSNTCAGYFINKYQKNYIRNRWNHVNYISDIWRNIDNIYYFNTTKHELLKIKTVVDILQKADNVNLQVPDCVSFVNNTINHLAFIALMLHIGSKVLNKEYEIRELSIVAYFFIQANTSLNGLAESLSKLYSSYLDLKPVVEFLEKDPCVEISNTVKTSFLKLKNFTRLELAFNNVCFDYPSQESKDEKKDEIKIDKTIEMNFKIETGQTLAIVGLTGSGKTSISKLIYRLYEPTKGNITVNGIDIKEIDVNEWRNMLSIVPQGVTLFNKTLRENIEYGAVSVKEKVLTSEIEDSIEKAQLRDYIKNLKNGTETEIKENGRSLSGGQLLRIAIARSMIRNAPIVVLDEYTSALDSLTEKNIQKNIELDSKDKIIIVIAHRLSTIKKADVIIVMNDGKISQVGSFEELTSKKGIFNEMFRQQQTSVTTRKIFHA